MAVVICWADNIANWDQEVADKWAAADKRTCLSVSGTCEVFIDNQFIRKQFMLENNMQ